MNIYRLERGFGIRGAPLCAVLLLGQKSLPVLMMMRRQLAADKERRAQEIVLGRCRMEVIKGKVGVTHIGNDRILCNTPNSVFRVLFDESTESGVVELGGSSIRICRTVFPKLNDFVTEEKAKRCGGRGMED